MRFLPKDDQDREELEEAALLEASPGTPLSTPIPMALYPVLATLLTTSGLAVTALFFVYEVTKARPRRQLVEEVGMSVLASTLLGFGLFFLLLWSGVYV